MKVSIYFYVLKEEIQMRKKFLINLLALLSVFSMSYVTGAETVDNNAEVSIETLMSENEELRQQVETLEAKNEELKEQIKQFEEAETETLQTEVIGVTYTDSSIVRIVQKALNENGYDCGTPDGMAGSKTAEAINNFEKDHGINVNGVITDELLEELGVAEQVQELAEQEAKMKEYSGDYTFTQIARDADSFVGAKMKFKGKVLQEGDLGSGIRYIRLAKDSDYDQVLFISYDQEIVEYKILDDDIITIYGSCLGEQTYETVMGASVTLPWIHADIIDMSNVNM